MKYIIRPSPQLISYIMTEQCRAGVCSVDLVGWSCWEPLHRFLYLMHHIIINSKEKKCSKQRYKFKKIYHDLVKNITHTR